LNEGASYVGKFAFGTNEKIDRFTKNMLFDEKIGGPFISPSVEDILKLVAITGVLFIGTCCVIYAMAVKLSPAVNCSMNRESSLLNMGCLAP
jgi:hypothetical protein